MIAATPVLVLIAVCALAGLGGAIAFSMRIAAMPKGSKVMEDTADRIRAGTMAFLKREYFAIAVFIGAVAILIFFFLDNLPAVDGANAGRGTPLTALSFFGGALASLAAGFIGVHTATRANVRATQAARTSLGAALRTAFLSGATLGLSVAGLGLLGLTTGFYLLGVRLQLPMENILRVLTGFGFGASSVALFARVGGGIHAKAAGVGADIVGKMKAGMPEDDSRNPAVIADNVGDNIGNVAGAGADLFESHVGALIAAMIIGWSSLRTEPAVFFPLIVAGVGVLASAIATFFVRVRPRSDATEAGRAEKDGAVRGALRNGILVSSAIVLVAAWFLARNFFPADIQRGVYIALVAGLLSGICIGLLTEYYASADHLPVKHLAHAAETGAATNIIAGLALGYLSTVFPVLCLALTIGVAYAAADLYGVAIAAVGMLSTLGMSLAADAYGPVANNAGGIAEMSNLPKSVRENTDRLDAAGNAAAAIGNGFATGSAALTALALFAAFGEAANLSTIDLRQPIVLIGLLLGGMLPFLFSSMTMSAVGRAAHAMIAPGLLAILAPITVGISLGSFALGGLLAGSLVTGVPLAFSMTNSGGAWDNAKKFIETGNLGGKGSEPHKASVIGDTVGDPFKDASGPSINILIKLMAIVSLLTAGLYSANGIL